MFSTYKYDSKSLVGSCPDSEMLQFQIVRGSNVVAEHERAMVEMISNPDYFAAEEQTSKGLLNFLKGSYFDENSNDIEETDLFQQLTFDNEDNFASSPRRRNSPLNDEECKNLYDEESDCLVDNLQNMWADLESYQKPELTPTPLSSSTTTITALFSVNTNNNSTNFQPKPWSSRSSPSGTFVRDPTTGRMKNVDV